MASPPHRPTPAYHPLPNPKKRPSLSVTSQPPPSKRRKHTSVSATTTPGTSHPLRQTSFPPEEAALTTGGARSPSVDSDATGVTGGRSVVTAGTGTRRKRGPGRKKKGGEESVKSGVKGAVEGSAAGQAQEEEEEEDVDGEGDEGLEHDGEKVDKAAEKKNLTVLVDAFNHEQNDRYDMFRRVKLKKETVRKIANQTLSQSVPPSVITTINGYTKIFIGTLIERAREIQLQYASPPPSALSPPFAAVNPNPSSSAETIAEAPITAPEPRSPGLGPLLPDHLREALRRYKRDGEGGGAGLGGWSLGLGVPGTGAARLGGRRLFR